MSVFVQPAFALGAPDEGAGAPYSFTDYEKALLRRAVYASVKASVSQAYRSGPAVLPILPEPRPPGLTPKPQPANLVDDDDDIVGWRDGKVIRSSSGPIHVRRCFPTAHLTVR